jgi:hypothetical protein
MSDTKQQQPQQGQQQHTSQQERNPGADRSRSPGQEPDNNPKEPHGHNPQPQPMQPKQDHQQTQSDVRSNQGNVLAKYERISQQPAGRLRHQALIDGLTDDLKHWIEEAAKAQSVADAVAVFQVQLEALRANRENILLQLDRVVLVQA